jgi:MFS family permease
MPSSKLEKTAQPVKNLGDFMRFGYYTFFFIVLYEMMLLPQMSNMTFMIYAGSAPRIVSCGNHSLSHYASNIEACAEMKTLQAVNGCQAGLETQFNSLAYEFGYICERIVDVKKSISYQMLGVLCGALFFGQLSDLFGRKKILLLTHVGICILDYVSASAPSLFAFTAIQSCTMFFVGGHNTVVHVFLLENIPKKHRVWVSTALSYSPNYVIFSGIAYLSVDWRALLRVASFLNIPAFIVLLFAFESPRWLIQKGHLERARAVLTRIERINGTANEERMSILDDLIEREVIANEAKKRGRKYYFYHLFYTKKMCCYTAVISYALLCTSIISYALIFNMEHLSGSIYLNSALFGLFRYSVNLLVGSLDYFVPKAGRKPIHHAALTFILTMLGIVFASKLFEWDDATILRVTTLSAAAMCSQLYMVNAVVTSELFPTAVRNLAASFVQISSRIGAVVAPHLFYLTTYWEPLPFFLMLCLMAVNMLSFGVFIPETKGSPMVDHMPDKSERIFAKRPTELHLLSHSDSSATNEKEEC